MSGPIGVGGDAQNVQLPMLQHALRPQRSAAPTEPSGDCPSGGSCAIYIGMSSIRSIHSIRRTKSLRKSLATNFFGPFPQEIARHKLFRLISSGNRPPQNFFSQKPQEIDCHKRKRGHRGRAAREWNIFRPFAGYCRDFVCLLQKRLYLCRRFMAYVR